MNLWRYDAACRALAEARAIDEVKDIRAKADALRAYARQAENRTLEIDASEIRIRAERRIGEIMAGHRAAGTLRPGAPRRLSEQSRRSEQTRTLSPDNPDDRVTLAACGINERLAGRARAYAVLTLDDFELRLARRRGGIERENARVGVNLFDGGEIGDLKKARRARRESELAGRVKALPDERFGVILDDPEWRFEVRSRETGLDRAADNHYPTSTLEDILARDIQSIAAPDCAWFRWVTVPHLANGLRSVAVDGFEYKTSWVWAKDRIGNGYWNRKPPRDPAPRGARRRAMSGTGDAMGFAARGAGGRAFRQAGALPRDDRGVLPERAEDRAEPARAGAAGLVGLGE